MKKLLILALMCLFISGSALADNFVKVRDGKFYRNDKQYTFYGTNMWYASMLGSEGRGGDRKRLIEELDYLKSIGVDNLRILAGSDGVEGVPHKVEPTLQTAPGVYNDTILAGLDFVLAEMGKRDMVAVIYLNNSWEWSGGYGYYLEQAGYGKAPDPADDYMTYVHHVANFAKSEKAQQLFLDHVKFMVSRTNRYTGKAYKDDPAIMSWQVCNEPRAFAKNSLPGFKKWMAQTTALIRSIDPNHLISLGSEGVYGCEVSAEAFKDVCSDVNVDYCNIHIWPANWGWASKKFPEQYVYNSFEKTDEYIGWHLDICRNLKKPLVIEEFGFPRDFGRYNVESPVTARDRYYEYMFSLVKKSIDNGDIIQGCNFWAWGGLVHPQHEWWQPGDVFIGDPAQEPQGLYAVFATDKSTIEIIKKYARD